MVNTQARGGSHTVVAHRSGQPAHLEGAEERKIGRFTDDKAGTSRQDRSRVVRGRWPVEQPRKKGPPFPQAHRGADPEGCSQLQAVSTQKTSTIQSVA